MNMPMPSEYAHTLRAIRDYRSHCARSQTTPVSCVSPTTAMRAAFRWIDDPATILVLSGGLGSGKSFAASAAMYEVDHRTRCGDYGPNAHRPGWMSAPQLANAPRWTKGEKLGADDMLSAMVRPVLVVIDDVGQESESQEFCARLQDVVNRRHERAVKTIITTNLSGSEFRDRYTDRIRSRLRQGGINDDDTSRWWIDCPEDDMRGKTRPSVPEFREEKPSAAIMSSEEMRTRASEVLAKLTEEKTND